MIQTIQRLLVDRGYKEVSVNIPKLSIYYVRKEDTASVIVLFHMEQGNEFSQEQYVNILRQIRKQYEDRENKTIVLLGILVTSKQELVNTFSKEYSDTWIVDLNEKRIVRFEDSNAAFNKFYRELESILFPLNYCPKKFEEPSRRSNQTKKRIWRNTPYCNIAFVCCNVIIFVLADLLQRQEYLYHLGAISWLDVLEKQQYYRLITGMFLHADITHLLNNMLVLFFLGNTLEKTIGKLRYLFVYLGAGILAGITSMLYNMQQEYLVQSIGASGAIFGVVGAVFFLLVVNRGRIQEVSQRQIILFIALSLYNGFSNAQVDNAAHIGGFLFGTIIMAVIYKLHRKRSGI